MKKLQEVFGTVNKKMAYGTMIAVVAVTVLAGQAFSGKEERSAAAKDGTPVQVSAYTVAPKVIDSVVAASGVLSSRNSSMLSSKVMGRVESLTVREGDQVAEGKLLMQIDSGEITAQAIQAQAAYNNAKLQYDRIKSLFAAKASTQMEMDQATLGFETAQAGLKAAKAMESYTHITAPIAGQIVEKRINLGEMAMPGQPLFRIEDNNHLRLETTVKEQEVLQIRPGQTVTVQIDAMPGKDLNGTVAQVVPAADVRTHSFVVKVDVPTTPGLITGMYGKAFFRIGKHEAIVVPKSAIVQLSGISGVYLVSADGSAVFQMIQTGDEHGNDVEVTTGLKPGDRVISDKHLGRIDGKKIIVAER